jgi:hypothetical protein
VSSRDERDLIGKWQAVKVRQLFVGATVSIAKFHKEPSIVLDDPADPFIPLLGSFRLRSVMLELDLDISSQATNRISQFGLIIS